MKPLLLGGTDWTFQPALDTTVRQGQGGSHLTPHTSHLPHIAPGTHCHCGGGDPLKLRPPLDSLGDSRHLHHHPTRQEPLDGGAGHQVEEQALNKNISEDSKIWRWKIWCSVSWKLTSKMRMKANFMLDNNLIFFPLSGLKWDTECSQWLTSYIYWMVDIDFKRIKLTSQH